MRPRGTELPVGPRDHRLRRSPGSSPRTCRAGGASSPTSSPSRSPSRASTSAPTTPSTWSPAPAGGLLIAAALNLLLAPGSACSVAAAPLKGPTRPWAVETGVSGRGPPQDPRANRRRHGGGPEATRRAFISLISVRCTVAIARREPAYPRVLAVVGGVRGHRGPGRVVTDHQRGEEVVGRGPIGRGQGAELLGRRHAGHLGFGHGHAHPVHGDVIAGRRGVARVVEQCVHHHDLLGLRQQDVACEVLDRRIGAAPQVVEAHPDRAVVVRAHVGEEADVDGAERLGVGVGPTDPPPDHTRQEAQGDHERDDLPARGTRHVVAASM